MPEEVKDIVTETGLRTLAIENLRSKGEKPLEERIAAEEDRISDGFIVFEDNNYEGYGVNPKPEELFSEFMGRGHERADLNYNILKQIWSALNKVERKGRGVPHEMLSVMNTAEILALYRAFAKLIKYGKIEIEHEKKENEVYTIEQLREMPIETAVSKMMGYGFSRTAMHSLKKGGWNFFPIQPGDLTRRIRPLSQSVKDRFTALLDRSLYEGIKVKQPTKKTGKPGKSIYITKITEYIQGVYDRNTQNHK